MKDLFGVNTQPQESQFEQFWAISKFNEGHKISHKILKYLSDRKAANPKWVYAMQTNPKNGMKAFKFC